MKLSEKTKSKAHRVLLFGPPKSGKTALAVQLARIFKLHWFDLEDGVKTALKPTILPKEFLKNHIGTLNYFLLQND